MAKIELSELDADKLEVALDAIKADIEKLKKLCLDLQADIEILKEPPYFLNLPAKFLDEKKGGGLL